MNIDIQFFRITKKNAEVFSILIPSWNNLQMLQLCIQSIKKNSTFQHQIIIHINEGSDGTLEWVKENNFDYTYSSQNIGICYAMNAMASLAITPYILYVNDDMYVCPKWDKFLYEEIQKEKTDEWYFSATMIEPYGKNICTLSPYPFGSNPLNFEEDKLLIFIQNVVKNNWFGASFPPSIVSKRLFDLVGGYSVEFSPGMYSDPDFSMKLWHAGVRNFKGIGKSLVYHFRLHTTNKIIKNDGRKQFAKKWKITASYFYKNVLRLGKTIQGNEKLYWNKNLKYFFAKIKALYITYV